ncbi:MAG: hypothetical protein CR997_07515 [Acidobacteria bacterium]|nr:MAG: hypothetical protein CR997_07515 [Acidobacteriota bacterium]
MAQENHVEDIYLKGMMAFSKKEYQKAYTFWKKVIELEPGHTEALKGIEKLKRLRKKKTPKEVLAEIKKRYAAGDYSRALELCQMLVDRFPDNQDLKGLKKKIASRIERERQDELVSASQDALESTMYFQERAEKTNWEQEGHGEDAQNPDVQQLIQQGVTLYELKDYAQAQAIWKQALQYDPGNRILLGYLSDVSQVMQSQASGTVKDEESGKPSKEELIQIYSEGKDLYKQKKYREALEKWQCILALYPDHKETLLCVQRTEAAIKEDEGHLKELERAEAAFKAGDYTGAERILLPIFIKAPHLQEVQKLKDAIDERKKQIRQLKELEMESASAEKVAIASDDEITKYFTPTEESAGSAAASKSPKMVMSATEIVEAERSNRNMIFRLLIVVLAILIVAGCFFIWKNRADFSRKIIADAPVQVTIPRMIKWYSNEARINDYMEIAAEYSSLGDYFMAYCAYDKVLQLKDKAIADLKDQKDALDAVFKVESAAKIAKEEREKSRKKIVLEELDKAAFESILQGWQAEKADEVIPVLRAALTRDYDDLELREYLSKAESQKGLMLTQDLGTLEKALDCFKRAAVLGPIGNRNREHFKVIQLFYTNSIDDHERKQWFFLFTGD